MNMDLVMFQWINGFATQWLPGDMLGIFLADWLPFIAFFVIGILVIKKHNQPHYWMMLALSVVAGLISRFLIKSIILMFYLRPRPYVVIPTAHRLLFMNLIDAYQSFPSGHALFFFAVATVVWMFHKRYGTWLFIISVVMGIARIFVGVHWPSDILAGALLGMATGYAVAAGYLNIHENFERAIKQLMNLQ